MASPSALPPNAVEDKRGNVIGTVIFCLLWSTVMVGMRLWARGVVIKQLGIDDYICIVSLLVTYGAGIAIAHMTTYGLGRHISVMDPANIPLYLRNFYVSIVMYCAALLFIKLTFLFQYYRVLAVQRMRSVYIASIIIVGGWALSQVLVGIFACHPISGFWDSSIESKCIPNIPQWYINAAGNIFTDVVVFALPLPAIWSLNLAKGSRIVLIFIFSLGFFTVIISIIRIRYLQLFEDFPWENVESSLWSIGELTSALTCACLPTMRPFVSRYFPSFASQHGHSSHGYANASSGAATCRRRRAGGPSALESGGGNVQRVQSRGSKGVDALSVSINGSEVELGQSRSAGLKSYPFKGHVVHEFGVGVETGSASFRESGVKGADDD
ncbi:uncharacterized protein B0H64DRAFT_454095 [Chaetomium fimeti]|uniref:Rhodopsin domain-containing protein n=1 Tax=Chaetomium fimeti TaxID=1854472 RepID=A0AAE0HN21_9PEZI|nr:hypothetical protein B0H64DRAFT_454095 [Chaetomium fimeti]